MRFPTTTALCLSLYLSTSYAWGSLGHETVAYVASNFVAPGTKALFQGLLGDDSPSYLAGVATWADSFRYTAAGRYSAPYHFIDAEDAPPYGCGLKYARDCDKAGCVVSAIRNYTTQLLDPTVSAGMKNMAAKFIVHFLGDIHQPLHDEGIYRGGNSINVTFNGIHTNLHHIWDTDMPEKLIGGYSLADAEKWANALTISITHGVYASQAKSWLAGMDLADPVESSIIWAEEANKYVCTTVLPGGVESVEGQELSGSYYLTAVPVIQLQIARAGYRLAHWLDLIAADGVKVDL